ncbi:hypothetical protein I551_8605 [Mycobacterium ulcerans str. Harvey]|uniref:Uncharacterized protein n=1 Tax=Mycobacterium ulcerans str. Harvey TaxID=1299332 RepID=A0ABN0RAC9_MYCUL|nr:hypothetical protein I551_8605 [Mycobacterium ulcerans str. Harvey]
MSHPGLVPKRSVERPGGLAATQLLRRASALPKTSAGQHVSLPVWKWNCVGARKLRGRGGQQPAQ